MQRNRQQPQLVLLVGKAGQDDVRSLADGGAVQQAQHPLAHRVRQQVLLDDRRPALRPARTHLLLGRHQHPLERFEGMKGREDLVHRLLDGAVIEGGRGGEHPLPPGHQRRLGRGLALEADLLPQRRSQPRRFTDRHPVVEQGADSPQQRDVHLRVEAEPAGRPLRLEQPVSPLPGADHLHREAGQLRRGLDAEPLLVALGDARHVVHRLPHRGLPCPWNISMTRTLQRVAK